MWVIHFRALPLPRLQFFTVIFSFLYKFNNFLFIHNLFIMMYFYVAHTHARLLFSWYILFENAADRRQIGIESGLARLEF